MAKTHVKPEWFSEEQIQMAAFNAIVVLAKTPSDIWRIYDTWQKEGKVISDTLKNTLEQLVSMSAEEFQVWKNKWCETVTIIEQKR
jgi:hypothetical protein